MDRKAVSFKMPLDSYTVVQEAAVARGVDVSSLLNWLIAGSLPSLIRDEARRKAAMQMGSAQALAEALHAIKEASDG